MPFPTFALRLLACHGLLLFMNARHAPSLAKCATVAALVLGSFYVTTGLLALTLLPIPIFAFLKMQHFKLMPLLLLTACCWITAYGLLSGLLSVRPPRFSEPGLPLRREDAPSLFALIDDLAARAGTAPPSAVYVSALPVLFVAETGGGFFGANSKRVLCIGAPYLATFSVAELRAVLAHELGHYVGGDTRVAGILAYTENAFRSVIHSTEENPLYEDTIHWTIDLGKKLASFVGESLVKIFAKIYLVLTRPMGRREELAADALAAELAGRDAAIRALESAHVVGPLYQAYLDNEVGPAVEFSVMPTDLVDGFFRFRERLALHGKLAELTHAVKEEKTDPFDTHPALADRVAALAALPAGQAFVVDASARTLLDGTFDLDRWLVEAMTSLVEVPAHKSLQHVTWRELHERVMPAQIQVSARATAAKLFPYFPQAQSFGAMLGALVAAYDANRVYELAAVVEPDVRNVAPHESQAVHLAVAAMAVLSLFEGALLERGAVIEESLGERCRVFRLGNETVRAGAIALDAMKNDVARRELSRWTAMLASDVAANGLGSLELPAVHVSHG